MGLSKKLLKYSNIMELKFTLLKCTNSKEVEGDLQEIII